MSPFLIILVFLVKLSDNLVAYDRANQLLNIPENEIHVITEEIDNYKPMLNVQFTNYQHVKKRKGTQTPNGKIRIETKKIRSKAKLVVENVKVDTQQIELRFGGGSKAHYPYNRVVNYRWKDDDKITTINDDVSTTTQYPPSSIHIRKFAVVSTTTPDYIAEPALILPSRFHRKKEDVVIVFKKKQRLL